jgi:hypothetical protein
VSCATGEIKTLRTVAEIDQVREFWASCAVHRDADPDLYLLSLETGPDLAQPYLLVLYRSGAPSAILLGRIEQKGFDAGAFFSAWMPRLPTLTIVHGGWIGNIGAPESRLFVRAIIDALRGGTARSAVLERVDVASPLYRTAKTMPGFFHSDHHGFRETIWAVDLPHGANPFLSTVSANERYNQRRRERRLMRDFSGAVRIDCVQAASQIDRLMRDAETVASRSYLRGLGRGFVHTRALHRRLTMEAEKGLLRGHVLYLAERPCAFWIGAFRGRTFYSDMLAYDGDYAKYAPGVYLVMKVIEEVARTAGAEEAGVLIDFGPGDQEYKRRLGNRVWQEETVHIFAPGATGLCINAFRTGSALCLHSVRRLLRASETLRRLRRARGYRRARIKE